MSAPKDEIIQMEYQNPQASMPLFLPIMVLCNTPEEEIRHNIKVNSARDLEWIKAEEAHDGIAVMVGGGGSIDEYPEIIRQFQRDGATVFAMNAASKWCGRQGITVDYQCILDAQEKTKTLIDLDAKAHLMASQVHPGTMEAVPDPIVWHCNTGDIEQDFPPERIERGGYALVSGGSACGNSSLTAAYAKGYRTFHIFGFDSCHRDGASHAYDQPMNNFIPNMPVKWGDRTFLASVTMKAQAEDFQITSQALKRLGCDFHLYGDGLLQTMYNTKPKDLTERDKYRTLWQFENYRNISPGFHAVPEFLSQCAPSTDETIIDFGCGTGKAAVELDRLGYQVFLLDFASNCRDQEAINLPFLEWDLTIPIPPSAPFGLCCDVMEHIPTKDIETVLTNIMAASETVFFQISTIPDSMGKAIGHELHLTVQPFEWWRDLFGSLGCEVTWSKSDSISCQFLVNKPD